MFSILGIFLLIILTAVIFYYFVNRTEEPKFANEQTWKTNGGNYPAADKLRIQTENNEIPPPARKISQPANTVFFENSRENLSRELLKYYRNF